MQKYVNDTTQFEKYHENCNFAKTRPTTKNTSVFPNPSDESPLVKAKLGHTRYHTDDKMYW